MAQRVTIGGAVREIDGGKIMVGGTIHKIDYGAPMVGGTIRKITIAQGLFVKVNKPKSVPPGYEGVSNNRVILNNVDKEYGVFPAKHGTEVFVYMYNADGWRCAINYNGEQLAYDWRHVSYTFALEKSVEINFEYKGLDFTADINEV